MIKISQPISPVLSDFLKEFTSKDDRADVANSGVGVSPSTLRELTYRNASVTDNSLPALKLLLITASQNAEAKIKLAKSCKKEIAKVIDLI